MFGLCCLWGGGGSAEKIRVKKTPCRIEEGKLEKENVEEVDGGR
jgi:hypothetical protein